MLQSRYQFGEVNILANVLEGNPDKVEFANIFSNENGGVSLVAFKGGQKLDTHLAPAEVMVYVVEGEIEFKMLDRVHTLKGGEFLLMGQDVAHSVKAKADSKVMLVKIKG